MLPCFSTCVSSFGKSCGATRSAMLPEAEDGPERAVMREAVTSHASVPQNLMTAS